MYFDALRERGAPPSGRRYPEARGRSGRSLVFAALAGIALGAAGLWGVLYFDLVPGPHEPRGGSALAPGVDSTALALSAPRRVSRPARPALRRRTGPARWAPASEATPEAPVPADPAYLSINSSPWGFVYLDTLPVGSTPVLDVPLAAGRHRLRVERAGFRPLVRDIDVAPGETIRITDVVLASAAP